MTTDGPADGALDDALERLRLLVAGDGDVLCVALDGSPERSACAGRADAAETPRLTVDGWRRLVDVVNDLAHATAEAGRRLAFHPHAGTFVETPDETDHLLAATEPDLVPLCLDVGHWLVGGGDPVAALRRVRRSSQPRPPQGRRPDGAGPTTERRAGRFRRGGSGAAVHGAGFRGTRPRWLPRGPRRTGLRWLADGRAGQQLGTAVGDRCDRAARAGASAQDG